MGTFADTTIAYNGNQALQQLKKNTFDLVSSDVMMPEMDGFELRTQMNEDPRWKSTPFILLTARDFTADRLRGFQLGVDDYLIKPFNPEELRARIYNLLKNSHTRKQLDDLEVTDANTKFINEVVQEINVQLDNPTLKVADLAKTKNYSPKQFGRIVKKITGMSPVEFILEIRLQKAYQLIKSNQGYQISTVRDKVGILSPSYFTTKFKQRFGVNPKELF